MRILSTILASFAMAFSLQAQEYTQGVHYQLVEPAQATHDASKVEVVEVFSYMCPHCANFQPYVHPWSEALSENVSFIRMPVVFRPSWEPFARAYYTAEALGVLDQAHPAMFNALHKKGVRLRNDEDIAKFFEQFGISSEDYLKAAKSFTIETKLKRAKTLTQRYGITGTPSLVVNGKYRTSATMGQLGSNGVLKATDYLIAKEPQANQSKAEPEATGN